MKKTTLKEFLLSMVSDAEQGGISSKRVWTSVFSFTWVALALVNTFTKYRTPEYIMDTLAFLIGAGFGFSTGEYFAKKQAPVVKTGDDTTVNVNNTPDKPAPVKAMDTPGPATYGTNEVGVRGWQEEPKDLTISKGNEVEVEIINKNTPE